MDHHEWLAILYVIKICVREKKVFLATVIHTLGMSGTRMDNLQRSQ